MGTFPVERLRALFALGLRAVTVWRHVPDGRSPMGAKICTYKGCNIGLMIRGSAYNIPGKVAMERCLEERGCVLAKVLAEVLDQALADKGSQTDQSQVFSTGPATRPSAAYSRLPEPAYTQSPTETGPHETSFLAPEVPAGELPCPPPKADGASESLLRRAHDAGKHARMKL